ncbi:putative myelin transcription factor 1-like protein [Abeliophyllum distichum]|uniref:Myelin transcription factor 1-like protein n=1 Tax=Abeliophyllum distichum TaxID=126358 RepID=A0ABD1QE22_9LAMI
MAYFLCFFQGLKPWIAVFSSFSDHGVLWISITTFVSILLSTLIFTSWKQKPSLKQADFVEVEQVEAESEAIVQINEEEENYDESRDHEEYLIRSSQDLYSESDIASMDQYSTSSEDSDQTNYWPYTGQKQEPDDSMSDEEGLIEIAIPSGQYLSPQKDMKRRRRRS